EEIAPVRKMIADLPIGSDVHLKLKRGKETIELTAKTQKLEGAVGQEKELKGRGLSVRDVTRTYANENQLDTDKGVVVTTLNPGYPAAKAELSSGDVILSVNQKEATDLDEFIKLYKQSLARKDTRVLLEIQRGRSRRSAVLKVTYASESTMHAGRAVRDHETFRRIKVLAIPPAWTDVWICPDENGHIQAVGRDRRGRKQYRYHPRWREVRDQNKYDKMLEFADALPKVRKTVRRDLARHRLPREKVLAAIIALLEKTLIRVGN